ncbi:MAG: sugar phosphate isomerase/epimerase [Defluviitaleaceae bacterium]|nr:sugar phosphate isomerase/epimerase [Defluviitaleaceae bacterium]
MELFLSTIGDGAGDTAREHGLGIEVAEFCYSANMDEEFDVWDAHAKASVAGVNKKIFHAPCYELCPAAIEKLVVCAAKKRFGQAHGLAERYGIKRMVVHSGYVRYLYDRRWFKDRSIEFWKEYLFGKPDDFELLLENTLEEGPDILCGIIEGVGDPRFKLCFDIGHAGKSTSDVPVSRWVGSFAPHLRHVHVHNNYGVRDNHNPPGDGFIDVKKILDLLVKLCPGASYTLETQNLKSSVAWMKTNGYM